LSKVDQICLETYIKARNLDPNLDLMKLSNCVQSSYDNQMFSLDIFREDLEMNQIYPDSAICYLLELTDLLMNLFLDFSVKDIQKCISRSKGKLLEII
jgi:hypothetical protein